MEEYLKQLLQEMVLQEKTEKYIGRHGSSKDNEEIYTLYWDEFYLEWTTKELAIQGFIFSKLKPIIREAIEQFNK